MNKTNFDFKSIKIPEYMSNLGLDKRGYPIPFNVLRDSKTGQPYFTVNDDEKYIKCIKHRLCAICGQELGTCMWFVGGIKSAFHQQGVFIDSPVHYDCGNYALKVCPYLATLRYNNYLSEMKIKKLQDKIENVLLIDPTVDSNKPECFAFVKTINYSIVPSSTATAGFYLKPHRPYLRFELWKSGQLILPLMYKSIIEKSDCVLKSDELNKLK